MEEVRQEISVAVRRARSLNWYIYLVVFLLCIFFYTRYNDFPENYHPDEPSKVRQLRKGTYNFHHPLLLVNATRAIYFAGHKLDKNITRLIAGRFTSALFAGCAVLCFMGIAHLFMGKWAALVVGLTTCLCPLLLTNAHYMKEDTPFLLGLAGTMLVTVMYTKKPSGGAAALFGIMSGIMASSKYIGVIAPLMALCIIIWSSLWTSVRTLWKHLLCFMTVLLFILFTLNYQLFLNFGLFIKGLNFEMDHVMGGRRGLKTRYFSTFYFRVIFNSTIYLVIILAIMYYAFLVIDWRKRSIAEKIIAVSPFVYYLFVSISSVQYARYILPVVVMLHYMAGLAVVFLADRIRSGNYFKSVFTAGITTILVVWLGVYCIDYMQQFKNDSRERLEKWIVNNMSHTARIVQDNCAGLPKEMALNNGEKRRHIRIDSKWSVGMLEDLEHARQLGYTHVVVCSLRYDKFFQPGVYPCPTEKDTYNCAYGKDFYIELFEKGELVWEAIPKRPMDGYTNPVIKLYRIDNDREGADSPENPEVD